MSRIDSPENTISSKRVLNFICHLRRSALRFINCFCFLALYCYSLNMIRESETGHFRPGETKPSLENLQQQYAQKLLERETARINYQRAIEAGVRLHNRLLDDLGSKEIKTEMAKLEKERVAAAERLGGLKAEVNSITDEITALAGADAD